jgi:C4-dicarboxylate transporter DctM subunit
MMDPASLGLIAFAAVLILLALRVPIAFSLASVATVCTFLIFAFRTGTFAPERAIKATSSLVFSNSFDLIHSYNLSMIPLFVALGHIAYRAEITTKIYYAAKVWLVRLPGGVAMASVVGCGGFRRSRAARSLAPRPWGVSACQRCCAWAMTTGSRPVPWRRAARWDR